MEGEPHMKFTRYEIKSVLESPKMSNPSCAFDQNLLESPFYTCPSAFFPWAHLSTFVTISPCTHNIDPREINCGIFFLYWQSSGTSCAMNEREVDESLLLVLEFLSTWLTQAFVRYCLYVNTLIWKSFTKI